MKKVVSACLCVTLHFIPDRSLPLKEALNKIRLEVEEYIDSLDENQIIYDRKYNDDGSVLLYVRKKVKDIPTGPYFRKEL